MRGCTFFGHRDCPEEIRSKLREVLIDLIENKGVDIFYVGRQGKFDTMVRSTLRELAEIYPKIGYAVVLDSIPAERKGEDYFDTMLPEGIENVHPHYAILWRNKWMLRHADYVVSYTTHSWGGAALFADKAKQQGKTVINIANLLDI